MTIANPYKHMLRTTVLILLISFCWAAPAIAQEEPSRVDTLIMELDTMALDTFKVDRYVSIVSYLRASDLSQAEQYARTGLVLAEELNYQAGEIRLYMMLGVVLRRQGRMEEAVDANESGLQLAYRSQDFYLAGANANALGNTYSDMGNQEAAIDAFLEALEAYEKDDYDFGRGMVYNNIGLVFKQQEQFDQAAEYYHQAIDVYENTEDEDKVRGALANVYMNLGNIEENDSLAIDYLQRSLQIQIGRDNPYGIASANISLGASYIELGQFERALPHYLEALAKAEAVGSTGRIATAKSALGRIHYQLSNYSDALRYAQEALVTSQERDFLEEEMETRMLLAEIYGATGNTAEANEQLLLHMELKDSLYNADKLRVINELETQYQVAESKAELAAQELEITRQKNLRNQTLIGTGALLLLALFIVQWYVSRQRAAKRESQQLKELDQLKTSFFTNISHELRTPLTLILGPVNDLIDTAKANPVRDKLGIVQRNAQRLLDLVNEIMDLSKVEAGKLEVQLSRIALLPTVKRIFSSFESLADLRKIDFQLAVEVDPSDVKLDREKFEKIITNLLANALKYTDAGGLVRMTVSESEGVFTFAVRDTGHGISFEDRQHIFDRFYQAKGDAQIQQGGTGVGLALSKELAQLLGGDIQVESEVGEGSIFRLHLPMESLPPEVHEQALEAINNEDLAIPSFAPISIQGDKPRVLIVEDNPEMGKYLLQLLSDHYQCALATDGLEALRQLKLGRFDCITSDVMMPNMDGFTLREHINEKQEWKRIPFLLLTARHLEEDKLRGFQLGIDDYITKPFSTRELHARVHNLIQNKLERDTFLSEEQTNDTAEERINTDQDWLQKLEQEILAQLDDPQFGVEELARAVSYSTKQLGRIVKKHTGLSTVNFILEVRLLKARELLEKRLVPTVTAAQLEVGISSMSYFTRKFTQRFGKNPKDVLAG